MRLRLPTIVVAVMFVVLGVLSTAPARASAASLHTTVAQDHWSNAICSWTYNACERVDNAYAGSDVVYWVDVIGDDTAVHTMRVLFDGYPRYEWTGPTTQGHLFGIGYTVRSGMCIQAGIMGLANARTPCWYAP